MKQEVLKNFDLTWIPLSGLVLFVACFSAYVYWTYKNSNKSFYQSAGALPLAEANKKESSEGSY